MNIQEILQKVERELKLRAYSPKTIDAYVYCIKEYLSFKKSDFDILEEENIKDYLLNLQNQDKSSQTINLHLNSIKYLYRGVFQNNKKISIRFAKRSQKLPVVLSRAEIGKLIDSFNNIAK